MAAKKVTGSELRFKIEAFTPQTMPMARLAEYMAELATVLGEAQAVHFVRLEGGSTVLVHKVEHEAIPKVRSRAEAVRHGDAPRDALLAYERINKFLRQDNGTAVLQAKKRGPTILRFPGVKEAAENFPTVRQHGSIDGFVMRVGGIDDTIPVLLESEGKQVAGGSTTRPIAKQLAQRLFEPVRLWGKGSWTRDMEGAWTLKDFKIESFEPLDTAPLSVTITKLRDINAEWDKGAYDELTELRHGRTGNGGR